MKKQIFGKKGNLSSEEKILAYFARIFERYQPQGTNCKGAKGSLAFTVEDIRSCFRELRGRQKQTFQ